MSTELFVYGTLRHDQPEHRRCCRGVTGWAPARARGSLWRLPAGYLILVGAADDILLRSTVDARADEARRARLAPDGAKLAAPEGDPGWVRGELLTLADAAAAWPPMDAWEGFTPGRDGPYQRCVVPVWVDDTGIDAGRMVLAWAYVAVCPPLGSARE